MSLYAWEFCGAHAAISMENHEHNVAGASALMKESAVNVCPCADNRNKQVRKVDIGINDLVKESAINDSLCEDDHNERIRSVLNCYCTTWH
ncbi:hypothetical protein RchiOBHm_Chr2g0109211 [Rosa chinensis]|uniref:Uncharacterized protein n=1 Tax=Rosa chinensis TaxID=74649 RepID=A0A2P6RPF4_ROSCH|nr:hypothetical protein RchiOBHm_Chr2g0109211 [Rosa chinensis]